MTENTQAPEVDVETPDQHDDVPNPDEGLQQDKPLPRIEG